jgi:ferredoxin-like protein FixX
MSAPVGTADNTESHPANAAANPTNASSDNAKGITPIAVNVDTYLALNRYAVDEETAHIELIDTPDPEEFAKLVRVCPAALYKVDKDGTPSFDYAGCLECGSCRIVCGDTIIKKWNNPGPTMGVEYRYG